MSETPEIPGHEAPRQDDLFTPQARLQLEFNDRDNAVRLHAMLAERLAYVPGWGWGAWDGKRLDFEAGEELAMQAAARELPRALRDEAAVKSRQPVEQAELDAWVSDHPGKSEKEAEKALRASRSAAHRKQAISCGNKAKVNSALEMARPLFRVDIEDLDADPWALVCENGVLDLKALARPAPEAEDPDERQARLGAALRPFDPRHRNTRRPAVAFDPTADCPRWRRFVALALPDPAQAAYLRRALAACLAGRNERQMALVLLGQGGNGKSTTANALKATLGGYAASCRIDMFLEGRFVAASGAQPEEAVLPGARAYIASEPETGAVLSSSKVKGLTGGEPRQSRAMYGKPFTWIPNGVPLLSFNKLPRITDESEGMWRRLTPVHFTQKLHELPPEQRVTPAEMERAIAEEASGILNWLLEGWVELAEIGLAPPPEILALKSQLRAMSDPVGEFLNDCTDRVAGGGIPASELHKVYEAWCAENGAEPLPLRSFNRALVAKDMVKRKSNVMIWCDLAWKPEEAVDRVRNKAEDRGGGA